MDLPIVEIAADVLASQTTPTQSDASLHVRGAGSVAEAAALAGAGPDAKLVRPRVISLDRMATCAIAEGRGQ